MEVVVNAAMSADGKLSTADRRQIPISGSSDFARVDALRADVDAIMVGIGTVLADDPRLTVKDDRHVEARVARGADGHPARVIADSEGRTPQDAAVLDDQATTYVFVAECAPADRVRTLEDRARVRRTGRDRVDLEEALSALVAEGIESILIEGGGELIFSAFAAGVVDRLTVFVGPTIIGGRAAPTLVDGRGFAVESEFVDLDLRSCERIDDGVLLTWDVRQ